MNVDINDPRLTAYALNELDDASERTEVEAAIAREPRLREEVESIRRMAGMLETAMASPAGLAAGAVETASSSAGSGDGLSFTFPRWLPAMVGMAAAVGLMVVGGWLVERGGSESGVDSRTLQVTASQSSTMPLGDLASTSRPEATALYDRYEMTDGQVVALRQITADRTQLLLDRTMEPAAVTPAEAPAPGTPAAPVTWNVEQVIQQPAASTARRYCMSEEQATATADRLRSLGYVGGTPDSAETRVDVHACRNVPSPELQQAVEDFFATEADADGEAAHYWSMPQVTAPPFIENNFLDPLVQPLSTFGLDVDSGSYAIVRQCLRDGHLPPSNSVRLEELINYFDYLDPPPAEGYPFSITVEAAECPWAKGNQIVRVGMRAKDVDRANMPSTNLVFLIDVSGSMSDPRKLPLVKESLGLLLDELDGYDSVAIVTYANGVSVVAEATPADHKDELHTAIANLNAGGGTNGEGGIQTAYRIAEENFLEDGVNRVILATDGDFNIGLSDKDALVNMIKEKAAGGVELSVFGFGMAAYRDGMLEQLADNGNGTYAYIDTIEEAKRHFVDRLTGTLVTVARDVKMQVVFNPDRVGAYRLLGYENRTMAAADFANDTKDAGDINAGHSLTALYEIAPPESAEAFLPMPPPVDVANEDEYTDGDEAPAATDEPAAVPELEALAADDLLQVRVRYKHPGETKSELLEVNLPDEGPVAFDYATDDLRLAASVAEWGMLLRDSSHAGDGTFADVISWLDSVDLADSDPDLVELRELVERTADLKAPADNELDSFER